MLKPRRKLTRHEIKQDRFITWLVRASSFVRERGRQLLLAGAALLAAVLVATALRVYFGDRAARAQDLLAEADMARRAGRPFEELQPLYQQTIDQYGSTPAARQALIQLAEAKLDAGDTQGARVCFQKYLRKHKTADPLLRYAAWSGIGTSLENEGNLAEAAHHYQAYADRYPKSPFAAQALLASARAFQLAAQVDTARELLQRIVDEYGSTDVAYLARMQLGLL